MEALKYMKTTKGHPVEGAGGFISRFSTVNDFMGFYAGFFKRNRGSFW